MCDYSLQYTNSRPAVVGDKLILKCLGPGTFGLACQDDPAVAVCVLPGTELAFEDDVKLYSFEYVGEHAVRRHRTVIFRQINKDQPLWHHDAIEFPDGEQVLLAFLAPHQVVTVLQLPAAPKSDAEAEETRLDVVG
jgi:hypothetical protein